MKSGLVRVLFGVMLVAMIALAGCKDKKIENKAPEKKEAAKPAEAQPKAEAPKKEEAAKPVAEEKVAAPEEKPAAEQAAPVKEEPAAEAQPKPEVPAAVETGEPVKEEVKTPEEAPAEEGVKDAKEENPPQEGEEAAKPEMDIAPSAKEEPKETAHVGKEFTLPAVMMMSDLVAMPEHYSSFDAVKVRARVLAVSGDRILLGFDREGNVFAMMARLDPKLGLEFDLGDYLMLEGKLVAEDWDLTDLGKDAYKPEDPEKFKTTKTWVIQGAGAEKQG